MKTPICFAMIAARVLLATTSAFAYAQSEPHIAVSTGESRATNVTPVAELPPVEVSEPLTEMAMSSTTDAATAANFELLSWYSDGFYNEYYRFKAAREANKGDWEHAARLFEIAARYSDKYSQHRLSLIHWHGVGAPKDRVFGYVWADIAAERGYPQLLAIREKMWNALTPEERESVPMSGKLSYAKYGDVTAMPLFRGMLARQRARHFLLMRSSVRSKLQRYYPESYLAQEAVSWKKIRVDIGDIKREPSAKGEPQTRSKSNVDADKATRVDATQAPSKP
jgi:hypothetical protein